MTWHVSCNSFVTLSDQSFVFFFKIDTLQDSYLSYRPCPRTAISISKAYLYIRLFGNYVHCPCFTPGFLWQVQWRSPLPRQKPTNPCFTTQRYVNFEKPRLKNYKTGHHEDIDYTQTFYRLRYATEIVLPAG